jgi:chemotaxis protein methyltransferase WspC
MAVPDFASLLKHSIGLDAASIGAATIKRAVDERQSTCGLKDSLAYWELVRASEAELQELIEAVVVPETWFFRDREAFTLLGRIVKDDWLPAHAGGVLNVLSLPSSTGEEAYSIAMTLLDAGVPADRFRVHGLDISTRALAAADRAVYRKNSFRGKDLAFRSRHFDTTPSGHRLSDIVRRQVAFERGNLLAVDLLPGAQLYDVIFCRNLLIYFDRSTQERAIGILRRLLTSTGVLFVAPSEAGLLLSHNFVSTKVPLAFAFRPASTATHPPKQRVVPAARHVLAAPAVGDRPVSRTARPRDGEERRSGVPGDAAPAVVREAPPPAPPPKPQVDADVTLAQATRLANQGHFREAVECCEESLRQCGPSAEIYHLLGVVLDASGDPAGAAACYRKALYLDPHHREVLVHLALLMEKLGQESNAQVLRQRARRLEQARTHG